MKKNKEKYFIIGIGILLVVTIIVSSYGFLHVTEEGKKHKVVAGTFNVDLEDGETIELNNAEPKTDAEGMKTKEYDFSISNLGTTEASYNIKLETDESVEVKERLNPNQIKYSIKKETEEEWSEPKLLSTLKAGQILLEEETLAASNLIDNPKKSYSIKLWVDENVGNEGQGKTYSGRIVIEAVQGNMTTEKIPNTTRPIIILKGEYEEYIEETVEYNDPGIEEVKDDKDTIDKTEVTSTIEYYNGSETKTVDKVNTNNTGVYYITYKIQDKEGNEGKVVRTVNVYKKDKNNPTIKLNGNNIETVELGSEYVDAGATAEDEEEGNITNRIVTIGTVNTKVEGSYTIKYIVEDQEGNIASTTREVIVESKEVKVTFIKGSGVQEIEKESATCKKGLGKNSCEITLPKITGNKGYTQTYWGGNNNTEYANRIQDTKVTVTDNTTYYAFAKDITAPICKISDTTPENPPKEIAPTDTATISIDCTDTSGSLSKELTNEEVTVTIGGADASTTVTKTLASPSTTIPDGKRYTFTLKDFKAQGVLAMNVNVGAVTDATGNQNISTPITTGITIKDPAITAETLKDKANPTTLTYSAASADQKKEMFEISHPDGSTSYRYIGDSPNNYVTFNDEKAGWRIIGVTNEANASGTKEWRIKLIRADRLNNTNYSWDNTWTSSNQNVNDWENAALNKLLNSGIYWTRGSGTCPYGSSNATKSCNFTSNGLTSTAKGQIENMKWYLGGVNSTSTNSTEYFYTNERGSTPGGAKGATTWNGNVGLPYPSDWGYTYAKGVADGCYNTPRDNGKCGSANAGKGWMFSTSYNFWTITPRSDNSDRVFYVFSGGAVGSDSAYNIDYGVRPVVYLQSNIQLSGEGTVNSPYTIK